MILNQLCEMLMNASIVFKRKQKDFADKWELIKQMRTKHLFINVRFTSILVLVGN